MSSIEYTKRVGSVLVLSTYKLPDKKAYALVAVLHHAKACAEEFAQKEGVPLAGRKGFVNKLVVFRSPREMDDLTLGSGEQYYSGKVTARINFGIQRVLLGRLDVMDLRTEIGKWFLYPKGHQWGQNREQDRELLRSAERFARFCVRKWEE